MNFKQNNILSERRPRRDFLSYLLGFGFIGWLGAVIYPIFQYLKPPQVVEQFDVSNIKIGKVEEVANNSSKMFKVGNKPGILIRTQEGEFRAFSAVCTHLDCTVQFKKEENVIWCACHNGKYDLNGKNISGPPPAPLARYNVMIQKDEIFVSK
jgi:cytochrome b6-f complex iron-sulfur subunit